jgi:hypothetical protein
MQSEKNIPTPLTDADKKIYQAGRAIGRCFAVYKKAEEFARAANLVFEEQVSPVVKDLERKLIQKTEELKVLQFCKDGSDRCIDRLRIENDQQFNRIKELESELAEANDRCSKDWSDLVEKYNEERSKLEMAKEALRDIHYQFRKKSFEILGHYPNDCPCDACFSIRKSTKALSTLNQKDE